MDTREPEEVLADITDQWMASIWGDSMHAFDRKRLAEQLGEQLAEHLDRSGTVLASRADVTEVVWMSRRTKTIAATEGWRNLEALVDCADMTEEHMHNHTDELRKYT